MATLTVRAVFEAATVLGLLDEPEFQDNITLQAARNVKPISDQFFAVFVFSTEPQPDGTRVLRTISTTVVGIQRYTTTRLGYQGIYPTQTSGDGVLRETLRAHYRAQQEATMERLNSVDRDIRSPWTKHFRNGAGDLSVPPEFIIADPDLEELKNLFSKPDPRRESNLDELGQAPE